MPHFKVVVLCLFGVVALSSASGHATSYSAGGLNTHGLGSSYSSGGLGASSYSSLSGGLGAHGSSVGGGYGGDYYAHPKYAYKYGVTDGHTGDHKDAQEQRDGDITTGEYSLLQPDGRKRTVHYTATSHGGFNAHVSYSGHAIHPQGYQSGHAW